MNGDSVVADYDLRLGNIDVDLDGLGPLQVGQHIGPPSLTKLSMA